MKKIHIVSTVVFVAVISVVIAIVSSSENESKNISSKQLAPQQTASVSTDTKSVNGAAKKATPKAPVTKSKPAKASKIGDKKVAIKTKAKEPETEKSDASDSKVKRVRWPGMKYRTVRVIKEDNIEPATELRTWTRKQWVKKVTDLRKADKDDVAEKYITAYNQQYPGKDLNNYLNK